jgi:DNA-binding MarR family transcriptional regulator
MHITTGTTTSILDTLERSDYIRRLLDPTDRRRVLVDVTPQAQAVLDEVLADVQQLAAALMLQLGEARLHDLLGLLQDVRDAADALPDELPTAKRRRPKHLTRDAPG